VSNEDGRHAVPRPEVELDAVVVGAGFAGLYMLYRLRELGFAARVYEAGSGVGGTWYWNRYPGARCDIESMQYQYAFSDELQHEWSWAERYATQPEILRYANHVADRFDLRRDIRLDTRVTAATFEEATGRWTIETDGGEPVSARFCVMATGCLSAAKLPEVEGLERFAGDWYHTGLWPHEGVDFAGKRVAVVGTGSSGIQVIPPIAEQADELYVFQRTPNYSVPANNVPLDRARLPELKVAFAAERRRACESSIGNVFVVNEKSALEVSAEERRREYEARWAEGGFGFLFAFSDLLTNEDANETAAEFVRGKICEIVEDPAVAELLCPRDYPFGTKRLCVDTSYFETFNRPNVTLVDLRRSPLEEITPAGLLAGGVEYEVDCIVFASGFDAMTGALTGIDIRGRAGETLARKWSEGPRTYLGIGVAGFPNLFVVAGPGSPSVLSNMMISIEQHVDWIAACIGHLRENGIDCIEPTAEAEERWVEHVREAAEKTLHPRASTWYVGANVPGKPRVFLPYIGGVGRYRQACDEVAANGYEGFVLSRLEPSAAGAERAGARSRSRRSRR
jgi:cyclohexanone monooxygenase